MRSLRSRCARITFVTLRACLASRALFTLRALRALRTKRTCVAFRASRALWTSGTCQARRTLVALRACWTGVASITLVALLARWTTRTLRSGCTRITFVTLRALWAGWPRRPSRADRHVRPGKGKVVLVDGEKVGAWCQSCREGGRYRLGGLVVGGVYGRVVEFHEQRSSGKIDDLDRHGGAVDSSVFDRRQGDGRVREGGRPEQQRKAAPGSEVEDLSNHNCRLPGELMVWWFLILVVVIEVLVVWNRLLSCLKCTHSSPYRT